MREIVFHGQKLAVYVPADSWAKGLTFFSQNDEFIQVGIWGYDRGKKLQPHIHNIVKREVSKTQEVVFVKCGRLTAFIYSQEGELVDKFELGSGDFLIALNGGHGYEILEDDTRVLEIKNGPYSGADVDRKRIDWGT